MCGPSLFYPANQIWKNPSGKYSNFLFNYLLVYQTVKHVEDWCISHLVCRVTFKLEVWFGNALAPPTKENETSRCWAGPNLDLDWARDFKLRFELFLQVDSSFELIIKMGLDTTTHSPTHPHDHKLFKGFQALKAYLRPKIQPPLPHLTLYLGEQV